MSVEQLLRPEPKRDQWGRYLITPAAGGKAVGHTRVTTFAKSIADTYNLTEWAKRNVALGMSRRPDLVAMAHGLTHDDRASMREVIEAAEEASGANERRRLGTAIHRMCERVDAGEIDVTEVPAAQLPDVNAYLNTVEAARVRRPAEWIERVCVIADYTLAGTFDRIVDIDGELFIADLKTGKEVSYGAAEIAMQLACYANAGSVYDLTTETHRPMPEVNRQRAVVIHLPAGEARCELHWVDIEAGWKACRLAAEVRAWRKTKGLLTPLAANLALDLGNAAPAASTPAATPERRAWVVERVKVILEHDGLNGGETAAQQLARLWPAGVPTLRDHDAHTDAQLDAIAAVLDEVEGRYEVPFGPADPATPPPAARPEPAALEPRPAGPDEGSVLDVSARTEIVEMFERLDPAAAACLERWVKDSDAAGVPFSTNRHLTERRVAIVKAAARLACWDPDDESARIGIGVVLGAEVQPSVGVGAALGVLTIDEATRLLDVATALVGGAVIDFASGRPELRVA